MTSGNQTKPQGAPRPQITGYIEIEFLCDDLDQRKQFTDWLDKQLRPVTVVNIFRFRDSYAMPLNGPVVRTDHHG